MSFIVTANALLDGSPRYLAAEGHWAATLAEAHVYETKDEAGALLDVARGQEALVCDPFVTKVKLVNGVTSAVGSRHRIRVAGANSLLQRLGYGETAQGVG